MTEEEVPKRPETTDREAILALERAFAFMLLRVARAEAKDGETPQQWIERVRDKSIQAFLQSDRPIEAHEQKAFDHLDWLFAFAAHKPRDATR